MPVVHIVEDKLVTALAHDPPDCVGVVAITMNFTHRATERVVSPPMQNRDVIPAFDEHLDQRTADEQVAANDQRSHRTFQVSAALGIIEV